MEDNKYFWKRENTWLKLLEEDDAEFLWESCGDTETRRIIDHGVALPAVPEDVVADVADYLENFDEADEIRFVVQDEEGAYVGHAAMSWIDERNGSCDISLVILEDYRGLGHGSNAMNMLLEYAFNERRLHKVQICTMSTNPAGMEFLLSLGFTLEATRYDMFATHGGYVDEMYFGMLEDEFRSRESDDALEENVDAEDEDYTEDLENTESAESAEYAYSENLRIEISEGVYMPLQPQELIEQTAVILAQIDNRHFFWYDDGVMLREMTEDDLRENKAMVMNSEDCRLFDNDVKLPDQSDEALEEGSDKLRFGGDSDRVEFAIENDEGEYVGNINLCGLNLKHRRFSASYYILPEFRGQGYAFRAMKLLMEYCFMELNLHKLIMIANADNPGSNRVLERLGLKPEGVRRDTIFYKGAYVSENLYGITREEYILGSLGE